MKTNRCWNHLPREVVDFLVLNTKDLAEQSAGPSSLDCDLAKKCLTRCCLRCPSTKYSVAPWTQATRSSSARTPILFSVSMDCLHSQCRLELSICTASPPHMLKWLIDLVSKPAFVRIAVPGLHIENLPFSPQGITEFQHLLSQQQWQGYFVVRLLSFNLFKSIVF